MRSAGDVAVRIRAVLDRALFPAAVRASADFTVIRWAAYAGFALLVGSLMGFSIYQHGRFALTQDFAAIEQVWNQVGHGILDPPDTIDGTKHYWQVHLEIYLWLIAPLGIAFRSALTLMLFQDTAGIVACAIAWRWMLTLLYESRREVPYRLTLALCSLAVLVLNPWIYWSYAFDFHSEPITAPFLIAAGYAFYQGKTRLALLCCLGVVLTGDVGTTYLAGLGITLIIASRRYFSAGIALVIAAVFWLEFTHRLGVGTTAPFNVTYGYLIYGYVPNGAALQKITVGQLLFGLLLHPMSAVDALRTKALDIYANLAPIGFVGILSPWALGVSLVVLAENQLSYAFAYSQPNFQAIAMYVYGAVGFTWVLTVVSRFARKVALVFAVAAAVNTLAWYVVWVPQLPQHWVRTTASAATVASAIKHDISPADEVIISQGFVGRFADRASIYTLWGIWTIPRDADTVQFIVAPYEGVNVESVNMSLATLDRVARYGATLRGHQAGVWWFTLDLNESQSVFKLTPGAFDVPAWASPDVAGRSVVDGDPSTWHTAGGKRPGYVVARVYWRARAGNYEASADLETHGPALVEVWDATTDQILARQYVPVGPRHRVYVPFRHLDLGVESLFRGRGPFKMDPTEAPLSDNVDVRVYTYGKGEVDVYRIGLHPLKSTLGDISQRPPESTSPPSR